MNKYIQHFVNLMHPNRHWDIYPEEVKGFSQEQVTAFADAVGIVMFNEPEEFLLNFGQCGAGIFSENFIWIYNDYDGLNGYAKENQIWIDTVIDEGLFTQEHIDKKPFFFSSAFSCSFFFVYTNSDSHIVWQYYDTEEKLICTDQTFTEFLESYLQIDPNPFNKKREWLSKETVMEDSTCTLFDS